MARLVARDGENCYLCGQPLSGAVHVDHVVPRARGGSNDESNLALVHERCNYLKRDFTLDELSVLVENIYHAKWREKK